MTDRDQELWDERYAHHRGQGFNRQESKNLADIDVGLRQHKEATANDS